MRVVIIILIGFMLFSAQTAFACSCAFSDDPIQSFQQADTIFVGKVLRKDNLENYRYAITIEIQESLKAIKEHNIVVYTNMGEPACEYLFRVGESYLIYAFKNSPDTGMNGGKFSVSKCSRTRPLSEAEGDIAVIKQYLEGHQ